MLTLKPCHYRAQSPFCTTVAELVFRQARRAGEVVGFKPQSLRRRGFEPHRMHLIHLTDWRNSVFRQSRFQSDTLWSAMAPTGCEAWRGVLCLRASRDRVAPSSERRLMMKHRIDHREAPSNTSPRRRLSAPVKTDRLDFVSRRLRLRDQGHGRREEDRGRRLGVRRDLEAGHHHRLRPLAADVVPARDAPPSAQTG